MALDPSDILSEFDDLANNVVQSKYQFFTPNLQRWFAFIDESPDVAPIIRRFEALIDFDSWRKEALNRRPSMGLAKVDWPKDKEKLLGVQIALFRSFTEEDSAALDFAHEYVSTERNFNDIVRDLVLQMFVPMIKDLRRQLARSLEASPGSLAPAADRLVRLDHNSGDYTKAVSSIDGVVAATRATNDYSDDDDRQQRLAELNAGKVLLSAPRVRLAAVWEVLVKALKYLADKFVGAAIGIAATAALIALGALLGIAL